MSRNHRQSVAAAIRDSETAPQQTLMWAADQHGDDIRRKLDVGVIPTSLFVESLSAIEGRMSPRLRDAQRLARLLRPFLIRPEPMRFGGELVWGYNAGGLKKPLVESSPKMILGKGWLERGESSCPFSTLFNCRQAATSGFSEAYRSHCSDDGKVRP